MENELSEFVEIMDEYFSSASENSRLEFLADFIAGCRTLADREAHKPFLRRMTRIAIAYQWGAGERLFPKGRARADRFA
jgi:hypothetical protein